MSDDASTRSDDTFSVDCAFDMPEHNLRGLRIFVGRRREASVDGGDAFNTACECRVEWSVFFEEENGGQPGLASDRGFIDPDSPDADQIGQAIDLALRLMETQKSINIVAGVAKRLVAESPEEMHHITPDSTWDRIQALVRNWIAKLRQDEFFKMQLVDLYHTNSLAHLRYWPRFTRGDQKLATLAEYKPHNAGMLKLDSKIVRKLVYHAASSHPWSPVERQKCLFHVANLIINQVQNFWVAFLMDNRARGPVDPPLAVYSQATEGLCDVYDGVNAGYHWDVEFFGGVVSMWHDIQNPSTDFNQHGGFGRILSIGDACLNRPDGSEQLVSIDSITQCTVSDFSDVCHNGLRVVGPRVPAFGFPFLDYRIVS